MEVLANALKANPLKFQDKAVKSNRSRVTNLIEYLPSNTTTEQFKELFIKEIKENDNDCVMYALNDEDIKAIHQLMEDKYKTWDWNFGFSPAYNFKKAKKIPAGFIEVHLDVQKGYIKNIKIFGDFFASKPIEELENQLLDVKHEQSEIKKLLEKINLKDYFGNVSLEEIIEIFN